MTGGGKYSRNVTVVLLAVLLIAVFAVGCTSFRMQKSGLKQLSQITEESIALVTMSHGPHSFALPKEEYGELVELLHEAAEKQAIKEELVPIAPKNPDEVEYCMTVISEENVWNIGCVKNGQSGANVFLEASNMTTTAGEAHLYWVHFEALCRFVTEALDAYVEEWIPSNTPEAVVKYAESILDDHLTAFVQEKGGNGTLEYRTELYSLTMHNTGMAGLDDAVFLYCLEYNIAAENDTRSIIEIHRYTRYMVLGHDYLTGEYTLLDVLTEDMMEERYGTFEMLAEYEDMYIAAVMELYSSWKKSNSLPEIEQMLKQAYVDTVLANVVGTPTTDEVWIEYYYGQYGNCHAVLIHSGYHLYYQATWTEKVDGVKFSYSDSRRIRVYTGENFCTLEEAFARKLLTREDLEQIAQIHCDRNPALTAPIWPDEAFANLIEDAYAAAKATGYEIMKETGHIRELEKDAENMIEIVFRTDGEPLLYVGVLYTREDFETGWTLFPVNAITVYDPDRWKE